MRTALPANARGVAWVAAVPLATRSSARSYASDQRSPGPAALDFAAVGHPTLGAPPPDMFAAFPGAADRLRASAETVAARAMEAAIDRDPTLHDRYDELGLRHLLRDTTVYVDRVAMSVASGQTGYPAEWTEWCAPLYRRRRVPMDDLINISLGLRLAVRSVLGPEELVIAEEAIDRAIVNLRWNRRIA